MDLDNSSLRHLTPKKFDVSAIRHPKEKSYGGIMLVVGCVLWGLLGIGLIFSLLTGDFGPVIVFIVYAAAAWFFGYVAKALLHAYMVGHYVKVSPEQFPILYRIVEEAARDVGLTETPQTYVYNSNGVMNAMALKLVGRHRYIWLTSAIIDADSPLQVRFVIGHELGHHVAGHLDGLGWVLRLPGHMIPFIGAAYSRARELTCDRVGAWLVQDTTVSRTALQMLACGSAKLNSHMNPDAFMRQERDVPAIAGLVLHIFSHYPRLTRRVEAVGQWEAAAASTRPTMQAAE